MFYGGAEAIDLCEFMTCLKDERTEGHHVPENVRCSPDEG